MLSLVYGVKRKGGTDMEITQISMARKGVLAAVLCFVGSVSWGTMDVSIPRAVPVLPEASHIRIQPIEDREPPTVPQDLKAHVNRDVHLQWAPSVDGVTGLVGYRVFRDGFFLAEVSGTTFRDEGVEEGTVHRYQVAALDGVGNASPLSDPITVSVRFPVTQAGLEAYSYPNPAVGGVSPVIRARGGELEHVEIKIYDLSGRLVESGTLTSAGSSTYEFPWTGPIASGTYYGLVLAKSGDTTTRSRIKISVVR
jgi:hypothetical protein